MLRVLEQIGRDINKLAGQAGKTGKKAGAAGTADTTKPESLLLKARSAVGNLATGQAFGGGLAGLAGAAGFAGATAAAGLAGAGLVQSSRGGSFVGGASRAALSGVGAIPILGELVGAAPANRILSGTESRVNSVTNFVARFGGAGAVTPEARQFLVDSFGQQERNVEADRQANSALISNQVSGVTGDQGPATKMVSLLEQIRDALTSGTSPGVR